MLKNGTSAPEFNLPDQDGKQHTLKSLLADGPLILYFYPADFTPGCTKEACSFRDLQTELVRANLRIVGVSPQDTDSHRRFAEKHDLNFPLLADTNRNLSSQLGILDVVSETYDEETGNVIIDGSYVTYRATYLIDEEGKIFHESVNDMPLGRNVNEYLRLVDAYAHVQSHGEVCPANWEEGKDAMTADREGVASYLSSH